MTAALTGRWQVPLDHPAFAGHFPGRPIVPGVLLLAELLELLRQAGEPLVGLQVASAKFLEPVGPGADLLLRVLPAEPGAGQRRFEIEHQQRLVASGTLAR
jgi:3-hydroxymyristoyl/3-hydroxydecanoyl-(acyl carrier protein) dehydratase